MNESNFHEYQKTAKNYIIDNRRAGLFLDMGLGKTVSTLTAANYLMYEEFEITKVLVIAPKKVAESVWIKEVKKWEHLSHLTVSVVKGTEKQRLAALVVEADIYTISRDNVAWLCGRYEKLPFDMVVIDESSSFKNHQSIRFKRLRKAIMSVPRVVILTGTPSPNGLIDLWAQIYLLDAGERLGKTISDYRANFFTAGAGKGHIVYKYNLKKGGEEHIYAKLSDICMSMKSVDYLDLPPLIEDDVEIEMTPEVAKAYKEFEREKLLEMVNRENGDVEKTITALNAAALSMKLQQFTGGTVYDEDRGVHTVHNLKIEALEQIMEEANGEPVLVAITFQHERDRIMKHFASYSPRMMKSSKDEDDWNAGKVPMMIMHPASGGHGLNLQDSGGIVVWYSQNWSLEYTMQFNKRIHRQGRKQRVLLKRLIMKGTIDEEIKASVDNKEVKQDGVMNALKKRIKDVYYSKA